MRTQIKVDYDWISSYISFSEFLPGNSNPCANLNQNGFSLNFHPTLSLIFTPDNSSLYNLQNKNKISAVHVTQTLVRTQIKVDYDWISSYISFSEFLPGNSNPCANLNQNGFSLNFHPTLSLIFTPDNSSLYNLQ